MHENNRLITDERITDIIQYMIEPLFSGKKRSQIEENINQIDREIKNISSAEELDKDYSELTQRFLDYYNRSDADFKKKILLFKSRDSVSSLRGYKEIYFNEIIQNANDILPEDRENNIDVCFSKRDDVYKMEFIYPDNGFSTRNLVGFLDMEMPTKREDLSSTGKHGVGIKSLYTFVDKINVKSNLEINIDFSYDQDETAKVKIKVDKNKNDYWEKPYTYFTFSFVKNPKYLENVEDDAKFNTKKLFDFIDACVNEHNSIDLSPYFFGESAEETIFDIRSLIFTDKNKNKKNGIKKISFFRNDFNKENKVIDIQCNETVYEKSYDDKNKKCVHAILSYINYTEKTEKELEYLVFVSEDKKNSKKQNFTVAFPYAKYLHKGFERYYETYYLSEADALEYGMNILINSGYSNTVRTKLADNDKKIKEIKTEICSSLIDVYEFMVSEELNENDIYREEISKLFHKLVYENPYGLAEYYADKEEDSSPHLVDIFYQNNINNRYLKKIKNESMRNAYIVYKREVVEEYERRKIGASNKITTEDLKNFAEERYVNGSKINGVYVYDTIKYDNEMFIDDGSIKSLYEKNLYGDNSIIRSILNIAGSIKELIYYRIMGRFPQEEVIIEDTEMIDRLSGEIYKEYGNSTKHVDMFWMLLGRYKLNRNIGTNGDINSASFHRFLFNGSSESQAISYPPYRTFKEIDDKGFNDPESNVLKARLNQVLVNKELRDENGNNVLFKEAVFCSKEGKEEIKEYTAGQVVFRVSTWKSRYIYYNNLYSEGIDYVKNSDDFGRYYINKFLQKIKDDPSLASNIVVHDNAQHGLPQIALISLDSSYLKKKDPLYRSAYQRHTFRKSTEEYEVCKMLNVSFIKKLYAHSWEEFLFYTDFIRDTKIAKNDLSSVCSVYTEKDGEPIFSLKPDDMKDMSVYLYKHYSKDNSIINRDTDSSKKLKIRFSGQPSVNLCPMELCEFIRDMTGINVLVMQTISVNKIKSEILYWYNNEFYMRDGDKFNCIGTNTGNTSKDLIIVHNGKDTVEKVINVVLREIRKDGGDICEKVASFIPNDRLQEIEYSGIQDKNWEGNKESQKITVQNIVARDRISCSELIKIITARGNNDNSCCCCGKKIYGDEQKLIITQNSNVQTQFKYPKVYEVVCDSCRDILRKRHTSTEIMDTEGEYYVKYRCEISNSRQSKSVVFTHRLCDGVRNICHR